MDRNNTMQVIVVIVNAVALRKESVDRNPVGVGCLIMIGVALRKESVDRNSNPGSTTLTFPVALRKESVDRNYAANAADQILPGSLSARRAWIEMALAPEENPTQKSRSPQGERG